MKFGLWPPEKCHSPIPKKKIKINRIGAVELGKNLLTQPLVDGEPWIQGAR